MVLRFRIAIGVLAALASLAAPAQERDILDMALERPLNDTINGVPVRFGDYYLGAVENALLDFLPRPWTVSRIHSLFLAASTRYAGSAVGAQEWQEWRALVRQLGILLAASRDPRAALVLDPYLNGPDESAVECPLSERFLSYFNFDSSYRRPPVGTHNLPTAGTGGCPIEPEYVRKWWDLNRQEVEKRATAINANSPACKSCEQEALATIDSLHARLHASAPTLHLLIQGGGVPRLVQMKWSVVPISGQYESANGAQNDRSGSLDIRIEISAHMLGLRNMRLSGVVSSPGYQDVPFAIDSINDARVIPITLVPVPAKP